MEKGQVLGRVAIHSVPRSGSTWLGSIFDSSDEVMYRLQPLFSYSHKGQISEESNLGDINRFFEDIINTNDDFVLQTSTKKSGIIPSFKKTSSKYIVYKEVRYHNILEHLMATDESIRVIGLIRNPVDVIESWYNAPKEFRMDLGWKIEDEWFYAPNKNCGKIEEFNGLKRWLEVVRLFQNLSIRYPNRFLRVKYEDLLEDTEMEVKRMFDFTGINYCKQTKEFLNSDKHVENPYSVYRNKKVTSKKLFLPESITKEIINIVKIEGLQEFL